MQTSGAGKVRIPTGIGVPSKETERDRKRQRETERDRERQRDKASLGCRWRRAESGARPLPVGRSLLPCRQVSFAESGARPLGMPSWPVPVWGPTTAPGCLAVFVGWLWGFVNGDHCTGSGSVPAQRFKFVSGVSCRTQPLSLFFTVLAS